ncbi:MAG: ATP-grasp domain-containing protein, partial [Actinomycetota bacterium]|nr:ATP-grasp domain-containing protein [Actinomycetota bacterium]
AARRGLPGPSPHAVASCQHKPTARRIQQRAVPEATPRFADLAAEPPPFGPPWFVKPAVGRLSQGARLVRDVPQRPAGEEDDAYASGWEEIAALAGLDLSARGLLAEEVLSGQLVTLEGYVHAGRVVVLGVTDSVMYPGTDSFERFEYPSRLPVERQAELGDVARRLLPAFGFDGGFFNVEFFVPDTGSARIVEVNARLASQFAPLYQAVHRRSTYGALLALACGDDPGWHTTEPDGVAVSYVRRVFDDAFVEEAPGEQPDVEILAPAGRNQSDSYANDPDSYRLAIVYGAGDTRAEAVERARRRAETLRFRLAPPRVP